MLEVDTTGNIPKVKTELQELQTAFDLYTTLAENWDVRTTIDKAAGHLCGLLRNAWNKGKNYSELESTIIDGHAAAIRDFLQEMSNSATDDAIKDELSSAIKGLQESDKQRDIDGGEAFFVAQRQAAKCAIRIAILNATSTNPEILPEIASAMRDGATKTELTEAEKVSGFVACGLAYNIEKNSVALAVSDGLLNIQRKVTQAAMAKKLAAAAGGHSYGFNPEENFSQSIKDKLLPVAEKIQRDLEKQLVGIGDGEGKACLTQKKEFIDSVLVLIKQLEETVEREVDLKERSVTVKKTPGITVDEFIRKYNPLISNYDGNQLFAGEYFDEITMFHHLIVGKGQELGATQNSHVGFMRSLSCGARAKQEPSLQSLVQEFRGLSSRMPAHEKLFSKLGSSEAWEQAVADVQSKIDSPSRAICLGAQNMWRRLTK